MNCILVARNNIETVSEIVGRVFRLAVHPVQMIIVDSASDHHTRACLKDLAASRNDISLILQGANRYCCHSTNLALSQCTSQWIFYLCSKEAFPVRAGWDQDCIHFMSSHPRVGIAGTRVVVPRYRTGALYMRMEFFKYFRNKRFALEHPDRVFSHVQGGFFILRRQMLDEIGYFNERLYHNYMDVEYSYYAESNGWELGDISSVKVRHYWTYKDEEFDPAVKLYHPLTLEQSRRFDAFLRGSSGAIPA